MRHTMRLFRVIAVISLITVLASASLACGKKTPAEPSFSPEVQQSIEQIISDAMAAENVPGVIVGVWTPDGVWTGARGTADTATGEAMREDMTFRIASNTKTYTATVILQLAEEGRLSLDDTLDKYVPVIPNADRITVRQLLDMTGGIYSYSEDEEFGRIFDTDPLKVWTEEEILDIVLRHQPDFEPGTDWHYSDTNYYLLGMIAEQVTGTPVEEEVQRRIIDRLGLANTWLPTGPEMPGDYAHGYMPSGEGEGIVEMTRVDPSAPWTGGAMVSCLDDMKAYVRALARGDLLTPEMQEQRLQLIQIPGNVMRYGLGIASVGGFLGHTGAINGYNSVIFDNPELDATIVVIANKSTNSSQEAVGIFIELVKLLYPELLQLAQQQQAQGGQQDQQPEQQQQQQQDEQPSGQQGDSQTSGQSAGDAARDLSALRRALEGEAEIYRGAELDTTAGTAQGMEAQGVWVLKTEDSQEEVVRFYDRELRGARDLERAEDGGSVNYSFRGRGGTSIGVVVAGYGAGTRITITIRD